MEIHRFEKVWVAASLLLIVGFVSTVAYGAIGPGVSMVDDRGGQIDPDKVDQHPEFSDPGPRAIENGQADVYVVAYQFAFEPGSNEPIYVPRGTEVTFHVTSQDVVHGFSVVGTNVNTMVIPGQIATFTVEFDETGEHAVICHEYCGAAHHTMAGTIEVVSQDRYAEIVANGSATTTTTAGTTTTDDGNASDGTTTANTTTATGSSKVAVATGVN
jgi:cytochrome c oxidase subunit 2